MAAPAPEARRRRPLPLNEGRVAPGAASRGAVPRQRLSARSSATAHASCRRRSGPAKAKSPDREGPHPPGSASACTASLTCPWPGPASGLTLPNRDHSGDPATRAAGVGCVRGFAGPTETAWRPGITRKWLPRHTMLGGAINAQPFSAPFEDRLTRGGCRVRGAMGKEKGRLKPLSSRTLRSVVSQ